MSVPGLVGILHFSLIAENYESSIKVVSEILGDLEDDVSSATDTDKLNPTTSKSGARTSLVVDVHIPPGLSSEQQPLPGTTTEHQTYSE